MADYLKLALARCDLYRVQKDYVLLISNITDRFAFGTFLSFLACHHKLIHLPLSFLRTYSLC